MNTKWIYVILAAFFEVGWVIGIKHAYNGWTWAFTLLSIAVSFYILIRASMKLPVGTVYAVFVGLGTAGTTLADMLFFDEPFKAGKIILITLLLSGVIGLKLLTPNDGKQTEKGEGA